MPIKIILWETGNEQDAKQTVQTKNTAKTLDSINKKWGIPFEIISQYDGDEIYREIFLPNRVMLKKRTGKKITELKSNKGNVYLNGVLAVFSNSGEILYFEQSWNKLKLLENLLKEGESYLNKIIDENLSKISKNLPEDRLVIDFIKQAKDYGLSGEIRREYPLVKPLKTNSKDEKIQKFMKSFSHISAKFIDILHENSDGTYDVIEAKVRLNWQALGQAVGYRKLFSDLNKIPMEKVNAKIVCRESDGFIEDICRSLNIQVIIQH